MIEIDWFLTNTNLDVVGLEDDQDFEGGTIEGQFTNLFNGGCIEPFY